MAANFGTILWLTGIYVIILSVVLGTNAQTCHKACSCNGKIVTCVGTNVTQINETVLRDIAARTSADILELTIFQGNFSTVPNIFTKFTQLQNLGLMSCNITSIANGVFTSLKSLLELHISGNPLKNFTADIFKDLVSLTSANFTHNAFETLALNEFRGLVALKKLFLNRNRITKLDGKSFHSDLKTLELLHINHNFLETIANDTFKNLTSLKILDIGWQSQKLQIPKGLFTSLPTLQTLFMTDLYNGTNPSGTLPVGLLSGLNSLINLDIRMNNLITIKAEDFAPFSKTLKTLYLGHNEFKKISNKTFQNLTNLEILNLFACGIQEFENGTFQNLTKLKQLNLESNKLRNLTADILKPVKTARISLRHNDFFCDCAMMGMLEWILSEKLVFNLTCATPMRLLHEKMYKLKKSDLRCTGPEVFSGKPEMVARVEAYISAALKCHATSYDHYADMSYAILEGNPVPRDRLIDVEEKKWTENENNDTTYHTELRINVKEFLEENAGKITCKAWNRYGNDTGILKLIVYPQRWAIPLWALILILIIVLLIVGLCLGCLVYYYNYRKVPISKKFKSPARYARQENLKPKPVSSISSSRMVLRPEYTEPDHQPDYGLYGQRGPNFVYSDHPDYYDRGEYNVAYLPDAPSMYVTYV